MPTAETIVAALAGVISGGAGSTLITRWFDRRRVSAETESIAVQATVSLVGGYEELLNRLTARVTTLEARVEALTEENKVLRAHVKALEDENELLRQGGSG